MFLFRSLFISYLLLFLPFESFGQSLGISGGGGAGVQICIDTGGDDTYTCPALNTYRDNMMISFRASTANTGEATLNGKTITNNDGTALTDGKLSDLKGYTLFYNQADDTFRLPQDLIGDVSSGLTATGSTGIVVETSSGNTTARSVVAGSSKMSIENGSGTGGNISVDAVPANFNLQDFGGAITDAQAPNNLTIDLATNATGLTDGDKGHFTCTSGACALDSGVITTGMLGFDSATQAELDTHKTSTDHDGRYYTKTELSTDTTAEVHYGNVTNIPDLATQTELDTHKTSTDHDGRYYTETELNTGDGAVNDAGDPIDWTRIKNIPEGFADGTDDGLGGGEGGSAPGGNPSEVQYQVDSSTFGGVSSMTSDGTAIMQLAGTNWSLLDPTDTSKALRFNVSAIDASTIRTVTSPNADTVLVQPSTLATGQFVTHIDSSGVQQKATIEVGDLGFDPATQTELDTHKTSSDHDGRYFTESEVTAAFIPFVYEGTPDDFETTVTFTDPTADRIFTVPNANSVAVQPQTCSGTDKFSAISAAGVVTCSADQEGTGDGGITTLNTLTATTQTFATGTTGTDFNIDSTTSTHTFNIPTASASNRGLLSTTDWSAFNAKQAALSGLASVTLGDGSQTSVMLNGNVSGTDGSLTFGNGSASFSGILAASNLSGTNTGDQTIVLSGDASGSGTGAINVTVANDSHNHTATTISNLSGADFANQTANTIAAGPTSGVPGSVSFRALVSADIPASIASNTTGTAAGITGKTLQGTGVDIRLSTGTFSTDDCVKVDANGNFVSAGAACGSGSGEGPLFVATTDGAVSDVIVATTLAGTGVGSLTTGAGFFTVGKIITFRLAGLYTTDADDTIEITLTAGGTPVLTTGAFTPTIQTGQEFTVDIEVVCRTTGATGDFQATGAATLTTGTVNNAAIRKPMVVASPFQLDTTGTIAWDVQATPSSTATSLTSKTFVLR